VNQPLALVRLAGLPLSLTLLSNLSGSVINRVMVIELGLPLRRTLACRIQLCKVASEGLTPY
jgi:hypothetical protein